VNGSAKLKTVEPHEELKHNEEQGKALRKREAKAAVKRLEYFERLEREGGQILNFLGSDPDTTNLYCS